jgi:putative salt-induced outer membrane protein
MNRSSHRGTAPLYLVACLSLPLAAAAQTKTDGLWRGAAGAAAAVTSGNTSSSALSLNADLSRATTADKITLGGLINYARNETDGSDTTTANRWAGFGQYDFNLGPRVYAFGRLGLEGDQLIDLNLRTSLAGGLGYKIIDTKETTFNVFGGAGYTTDKYDVAQSIGGKIGTSFSRSSLFLGEESSHQLSPSVSVKQRLELWPGLSGDKARLAKFTAGLSVAMSSTLNLNLSLINNYNSKPPEGSKKNDLGFFTGVNVKLGAL